MKKVFGFARCAGRGKRRDIYLEERCPERGSDHSNCRNLKSHPRMEGEIVAEHEKFLGEFKHPPQRLEIVLVDHKRLRRGG